MHRYRISYSKEGVAKFMSHLDLVRNFERALRRAGLPVTLSQGFNPHAKLSFAFPLPVGVAGLEEYVDIELDREFSPAEIINRVNDVLPQGIKITGSCRLDNNAPALMAQVERSTYVVRVHFEKGSVFNEVRTGIDKMLDSPEVFVNRRKKDGSTVPFDIRPGIVSLTTNTENNEFVIEMELMAGSQLNIRPGEVIEALKDQSDLLKHCHLETIRQGVRGQAGKNLFDYCSGSVVKTYN